MNSDHTQSRTGRVSTLAPAEEEFETAEPVPDDGEPAPTKKKIPGRRLTADGRPAASVPPPADCAAPGGQMVLSSAKYMPADTSHQPAPRAAWKDREEHEPEAQTLEGNLLNGGVGGGILAMVVALIWLVAGLMNDVLFFYPPVLFVIGLFAFLKGLNNSGRL